MGTFHPFQNAYRADPYPYLDRLRQTDPVHYSPELQGFVLTRYEDCSAVLRDDAHFLSDPSSSSGGIGESVREARQRCALGGTPVLANTDSPVHSRLRSTLAHAFSPRSVESQSDHIDDTVDRLLDAVQPGRPTEFMSAVAGPLPVEVLLGFIGVVDDCRDLFRGCVVAMMRGRMESDRSAEAAAQSYAALRTLGHILDRSLAEPGESLLKRLDRSVQDETISAEEMAMLVTHVATAGNAATAFAIGNMLLALSQQPEAWEQLRADLDRVPAAVEECLRFESPTHITTRFTAGGACLAGKPLAPGRTVHVVIPAANRDPAAFPEPRRFDLSRRGSRQLAFGLGDHFCLGAPLARLEMQAVLTGMLRRFSSLEPAKGGYVPGGTLLLRGPQRLQLVARA